MSYSCTVDVTAVSSGLESMHQTVLGLKYRADLNNTVVSQKDTLKIFFVIYLNV